MTPENEIPEHRPLFSGMFMYKSNATLILYQ